MANQYIWWIDPLDTHTNNIISAKLREKCEESCSEGVTDNLGQSRDLWRCSSYDLITRLYRDREQSNLRFKILRSSIRGDNSFTPPVEFSFRRINPARKTKKPA